MAHYLLIPIVFKKTYTGLIMNFRNSLSLSALAVAGAIMSLPAAAIPFTVTPWAAAGSAPVKIKKTDPTATTYSGSGGGFVMTNTDTLQSFVSWCVDIFQVIPSGTGQYSLDAGGIALDPTIRNDLGRLATLALAAATTAGQNYNAAAFQLAVWEILYEAHTPGYTYNLAAGTFQSTLIPSTPHSTAQSWLTTLNSNPGSASSYTIDVYRSDSLQDQITFKSVPEPATLGLLAVGLIGIGFARRKSAQGKSSVN